METRLRHGQKEQRSGSAGLAPIGVGCGEKPGAPDAPGREVVRPRGLPWGTAGPSALARRVASSTWQDVAGGALDSHQTSLFQHQKCPSATFPQHSPETDRAVYVARGQAWLRSRQHQAGAASGWTVWAAELTLLSLTGSVGVSQLVRSWQGVSGSPGDTGQGWGPPYLLTGHLAAPTGLLSGL